MRAADNATEITAMKMQLLVGNNIRFHVAKCRIRLVPDAVIESLNDVFLEL